MPMSKSLPKRYPEQFFEPSQFSRQDTATADEAGDDQAEVSIIHYNLK